MTTSPTALVTGASSGIGLEIARRLAARGYRLVLVARRQWRLEEITTELRDAHGIDVSFLVSDLSRPDGPQYVYQTLQEQGVVIDVLVNNAGMGMRGEFADCDIEQMLELLHVNMIAATHLTRLFLPGMVGRGSGRILNVSSVCANVPGPLTAVYSASKAYLQSFSQALAYELRETGVTLTTVCPGPTETRFAERAGLQNTRAFSAALTDPASVAKAAVRAMERGQRMVVPGARNKLRMLSTRLAPRNLLAHFSAKYHQLNAKPLLPQMRSLELETVDGERNRP